jgi:UDP-N-acetylglucosamine diphosphorylase/glucosamine-1-phosphate N-acetyltransferase
MANRLIIFEDEKYADFYPITLSRPVFCLLCGAAQLWEKTAFRFPEYEPVFSCRSELASLLHAETGHRVNQIDYEKGDRLVFVNGRLRLGDKLAQELESATDNRIYHHGGITAAVVVSGPLGQAPETGVHFTGEGASEALGITADIIAGEFDFYDHLWDCVDLNSSEIAIDYEARFPDVKTKRMLSEATVDSSARILSDDNLYIAPGAEIGAGTVVDNRSGPVIIDRDAVIGPLSFIEGPCYIGRESHIYRGNIRAGCSFGPCCRIGGEVEASIFHSYSNKYHDGFMGHAYIGSWVNLGAMTTNSDLKNNYKNIAVTINGRTIDSGRMKIGSFIGDHSKTGIGTLINTGVSIGFSCNIYGGTLVTSREVLSFSWGDERGYDIYRLDKAIEVARAVMLRRNVEFSPDHERLFAEIYEKTTAGR